MNILRVDLCLYTKLHTKEKPLTAGKSGEEHHMMTVHSMIWFKRCSFPQFLFIFNWIFSFKLCALGRQLQNVLDNFMVFWKCMFVLQACFVPLSWSPFYCQFKSIRKRNKSPQILLCTTASHLNLKCNHAQTLTWPVLLLALLLSG